MKSLRSPLLFTLFGLLMGLAISAVVALLSAAPRGAPVMLQPAPTPAPIQVDISGAVKRPGVYALPAGSRAQEAIDSAGGLSDSANREAVNLAAALKDGQKLVIPAAGTPAAVDIPVEAPASRAAPVPAGKESAEGKATPTPEFTGPVNLNTATAELLQTLPGVGPTRAQDIIAYREAHGGFKTIEELQEVKGIGPATFEKLKGRITVE